MALLGARWIVVVVLATARLSLAACGDDPGDAAAVAAARSALDSACPCATATAHGAYMSCARGSLAMQSGLRGECRAALTRCAAKSTCGRAGAVTCCRTRASGDTRCNIKRGADRCVAPAGGSACVGEWTSCCDACVAGGCAPPPPPVACESSYPACGGTCPGEGICGPSAISTECICYPGGSQPCGDSVAPMCNGTCPVGERCGSLSFFGCGCIPEGMTGCGEALCGEFCPGGETCYLHSLGGLGSTCSCAPTGVPCCEGGLECPGGQVCRAHAGFCGCL